MRTLSGTVVPPSAVSHLSLRGCFHLILPAVFFYCRLRFLWPSASCSFSSFFLSLQPCSGLLSLSLFPDHHLELAAALSSLGASGLCPVPSCAHGLFALTFVWIPSSCYVFFLSLSLLPCFLGPLASGIPQWYPWSLPSCPQPHCSPACPLLRSLCPPACPLGHFLL